MGKKPGQLSIFLTGGTGFFGKNILRKLQPNVKLAILSRNPAKFKSEFSELVATNISFIKGDIRDFKLPNGIMYDYVMHGATEASAKLEKENPQEMYSVIVDGTKNLLKQIKGRGVERLLFISSGGIYGRQPPELSHIPETHPPSPLTSYGKGKLEAEKLCLESGIPSAIARCFAFIGPYLPLDAHFAIGNFILNGLRNEPIIVKGDGSPYRSYMYADDLVEWLWTILIKGKAGERYNVGAEEAISIVDLARLVSSCFDNKSEVRILGIPTNHEPLVTSSQPRNPEYYVPSTQKAQKELGLKIKVDLKESILNTIEFNKRS